MNSTSRLLGELFDYRKSVPLLPEKPRRRRKRHLDGSLTRLCSHLVYTRDMSSMISSSRPADEQELFQDLETPRNREIAPCADTLRRDRLCVSALFLGIFLGPAVLALAVYYIAVMLHFWNLA